RELHPRERDVERAREGLREHRLPDTREILEDQVTLTDEAEDAHPKRLRRRMQDPGEILDDRPDRLGRRRRLDPIATGLAHATAPQPCLRSPPRSGPSAPCRHDARPTGR